jgi:Stress responsive A/B Barrel Domain
VVIAHNVYFTLKDNSPESKRALLDACHKYLSHHPGTIHFWCGVLAEDHVRDVNDRDWEVGLHVIFEDKAAHDYYHDHPDHQQFVAETQPNWAASRVFDTWLE